MKKKMILLTMAVLPIFAGCGNSNANTLTCTRTRGDFTQSRIIEFNSDKTKVTRSAIEVTYDFTNVTDFSDYDGCDDASSCLKIAETSVDDCKNDDDFENCEIRERTGKKVVIRGYYKQEKADDEFGEDDYAEIKDQLESYGYTCKE